MGCFRIVYCDLTCVRCGSIQPQGVQFYTGNDYDFPEYEEGQVVPDLAAGEYEGIGQILCHPCVNGWLEVKRLACLEAISQMVREGVVTIENFASVHLHSVAPKKTDVWPQGFISSSVSAVSNYFGLRFEDFRQLQERTSQRLTDEGWPAEMDQDMPVLVDAQHHVTVTR